MSQHPRNKPFRSSAQNFEDVVLWRVLADVEKGCYVDVGACEPVVDSITWAFYEQGWRGALVEPVPSLAAELRRGRPDDLTIEAAAGLGNGTARLYVSEPIANSTLVRDLAERVAEAGSDFSETVVRIAPLDELLEEAGFDGSTIHFCTIDVEGSEADVLSGFDLARWGPWILVVEATEPNRPRASHYAWEPHVLEAGYRFCLFDGLNRFYVHPGKADAYADRLAYPACIFDDAFARRISAGRRAEELERAAALASHRADEMEQQASRAIARVTELEELAARLPLMERENATLATRANEAVAELRAMKATISWRVTRPLRAVRAKQLGTSHLSTAGRLENTPRQRNSRTETTFGRDEQLAFIRRLVQATEILLPNMSFASPQSIEDALDAFGEAVKSSTAPNPAKAWLSLVAIDGRYPGEQSVGRMARVLRMYGAQGFRGELLKGFAQSVEQGLATTAELDIRRDRIVVDVTHTVMANDLHTGIQRVVRETVSRWIDAGRPMDLVQLDLQRPAARLLTSEECDHFRSWRAHVRPTAKASYHAPNKRAAKTLVPWQCQLVVPELPFEPERTAAYRGLATASVLRSLSMVGYDLIPIVAAEKVAVTQVTTDFAGFLSVVKHADRVSTISRTSRDSFEAFAAMAAAEGLRGPRVEAHELPTEAPTLDAGTLERARSVLGVGAGPLILVVGSHEPRKNHLAVLEAAERLWAREGHSFELLFLGWSGWLGQDFDELVDGLISAGRPIGVRKSSPEEELWAAYRLARFTVFPSLFEGYGLPIAESLASGTPVITSNYGSMAEVAGKGGCLLVDPRKVDELEEAMARLLHDEDALGKLRDEALEVDTGTWESYASRLWDFFTETAAEEQLPRAP